MDITKVKVKRKVKTNKIFILIVTLDSIRNCFRLHNSHGNKISTQTLLFHIYHFNDTASTFKLKINTCHHSSYQGSR